MQLPRIPSFIPMGPIRRKRSQRVAELRAEDAKIQAARHARMTRRSQGHHTSRAASVSQPNKPVLHTKSAATPALKRPALHHRAPAVPLVAATVAVKPVKQVSTPTVQPAAAAVAAVPSPAISNYVAKPRGTYANDFSHRTSYTAQPSRS